MMRRITEVSPELAPIKQRHFQELDERYSKWREWATNAKAEIIVSELNIRTAPEQREYLWRLAERVKRDTEQLSNFTRELVDILLCSELEDPPVALCKQALASEPLTDGPSKTLALAAGPGAAAQGAKKQERHAQAVGGEVFGEKALSARM